MGHWALLAPSVAAAGQAALNPWAAGSVGPRLGGKFGGVDPSPCLCQRGNRRAWPPSPVGVLQSGGVGAPLPAWRPRFLFPVALLDRSGKSECPCLVSSLRGKASSTRHVFLFPDLSVKKLIHLLIFSKSQLLVSLLFSIFLFCIYRFLF